MPEAPNERSTLMQMGGLLISLQTTEAMIKQSLSQVMNLTGPEFLKLLNEDKRTLGAVLTELRKRTKIERTFDSILGDYLLRRNTFIHKVQTVPGWSLQTQEGLAAAQNFILKLHQLNETVFEVFVSLLQNWHQQNPSAQRDIGLDLALTLRRP